MYDSTITAIAGATGEASPDKAVEGVRHGGPGGPGPLSQNSHRDRLRLNRKQEDEDGELEIA